MSAAQRWTLAVHGGAGRMERATTSATVDAAIRAALGEALAAGSAVLAGGGAALDAVEAAVHVLEDDPHFNAGRGAALTLDGGVELDAAVMDGEGRRAGAVAGVSAARHPVSLARAVMERSPHVFMAGAGADAMARAAGLELAEADWFATAERRKQLADLKARGGASFDVDMKYGTVGAVALDSLGHLAAATSTGGVTGKRPGRIGDTPVIGAGTWADDRACAVSCTGAGEFFLRAGAAQAVGTALRWRGMGLDEAVAAALEDVRTLGGTGGMIAVAPDGEVAIRFTTPGMYRASLRSSGERTVALYRDE